MTRPGPFTLRSGRAEHDAALVLAQDAKRIEQQPENDENGDKDAGHGRNIEWHGRTPSIRD